MLSVAGCRCCRLIENQAHRTWRYLGQTQGRVDSKMTQCRVGSSGQGSRFICALGLQCGGIGQNVNNYILHI